MLVEELLGEKSENGLAAIGVLKAYVGENRVEDMLNIIQMDAVLDLIKGLCFTNGIIASIITGDDDGSRLYQSLRRSLDSSPDEPMTLMEEITLNLLDASQEGTSERFSVILVNLEDKVGMIGTLCALTSSLLANEVFSSNPVDTLTWLRNAILDDYINQKL